jgi:transposase InsO family protein
MPWRELSIMSQRNEFVVLASAPTVNMRALCQRFGISATTAYKWLARHRLGEGLGDRSRRPQTSPGRTREALEREVLGVRCQHPVWGGRKIRARLLAMGVRGVPAASTITAILRRHGQIAPAESVKHRCWRRFERSAPNQLWQMDFKGHVPMHRGGRCHPLTVLDDHSRFAVALRACGNERHETVREEFVAVFRRYGLPEQILSDNGPPWGTPGGDWGQTRLTLWMLRLGVRVIHGRPAHPQTQGKAERFHRTLAAELLSRQDLRDLGDAQRCFDSWRDMYNLERPSEALGDATPASRYRPSPRPYPERLPPLGFGPDDLVRRVRRDGMVRFAARSWYMSTALAGELVGLRPTRRDGEMLVCYGPHPIGRIDLAAATHSPRAGPGFAALTPGHHADGWGHE